MRYARQEKLIDQEILGKSLVTIVGCGGTGTAAAEYLARAGVNLRLIDRDIVELINLQRQLFGEADLGKPKAEALKERLEAANSEVRIEAINDDLNSTNIDNYLSICDIILDGTDNMDTRFLINDYCSKHKIPFTYAAAIQTEGLFTLFIPKKTPCLRCFVPKSEGKLDTCETAGIVGPTVGAIGVISAMEAIKHLTGEATITGHMLHINFFKNLYEILELHQDKNCKTCNNQYEFLALPAKRVTMLCGGTFQYIFQEAVNPEKIAERIENLEETEVLKKSREFAQIKYKDYVISIFENRALLQNIYSERAVKTVVSRIIGI